MLTSPASDYGDLQLVACPVGMELFNDHPSICRTSDRTQKQGTAKQPELYWYLPDILASVHVQLLCDGEKCRRFLKIIGS